MKGWKWQIGESFINWLHTLVIQMDNTDEINNALFQHEKKSYQKRLLEKKKLVKNNTTEKKLCVKYSAYNTLDGKWNII